MKRIPPKGTPEARRYWRDRALKADLEAIIARVAAAAGDCSPGQRQDFMDAYNTACVTFDYFALGHNLPYLNGGDV